MKIKYLKDTDTALLEFSDHQVDQTKEINENIYVDLDAEGNLVNMTIEHAGKQANISEVAYQQSKNNPPDRLSNLCSTESWPSIETSTDSLHPLPPYFSFDIFPPVNCNHSLYITE